MTDATPPTEVLLEHRAWLLRLARAIARDDATADDLAQETWVRALRSPPRHRRSIRAWLGTILRRAAVDRSRAEGTRQRHEVASGARGEEAEPVDILARAELARRVMDAVLRLNEPYRTTVLLRFWDERAADDIAVRSGVPAATVRTRLRRALARLRSDLDDGERGRARLIALLLLGDRPGQASAGGAWSTVVATTGGIALMTAKTKATIAAVVLLLVAGATWRVTGGSVGGPPAESGETRTVDARTETKRDDGAPELVASRVEGSGPNPEAITGRVVDARSAQPLPGAEVRVGDIGLRMLGDPDSLAGEDGRFRVPIDPTARPQRALVSAPGYVTQTIGLRGKDSVDLGDVRLGRGFRLRGRVLASDGVTPVPRATILWSHASLLNSEHWIGTALVAGVTNESGTFEVAIPHVSTTSRGGLHGKILLAQADAGVGWTEIRQAEVAGLEELEGVDVVLRPSGRIVVTVRDEDGAPIEDALVQAAPLMYELAVDPVRHRSFSAGALFATTFNARTDAAGEAIFASLPVEGTSQRYLVRAGARRWLTVVMTRRIEPGREDRVDVVLQPAGSWTIAGRVIDEAGGPVEGAIVRLRAFTFGAGRTASDGSFRIGPLEASFSWTALEISAAGRTPVTVERVEEPVGGGERVVGDVLLRRVVPIAGRVASVDGAPLAGVSISASCRDSTARVPSVTTSPDGLFRLETHAGRWTIWAGGRDLVEESVEVDAGDEHVLLTLERRVPGSATATLDIVDEATGAPLVPSDVVVHRDAAPSAAGWPYDGTITPELGRIVLRELPVGRWRVWLRFDDRTAATVAFSIDAEREERRVRLEVGSGGTLEGLVDFGGVSYERTILYVSPVDVASRPTWAHLRTNGARGAVLGGVEIGPDGTFRADGITPGRYRLRATIAGRVATGVVDVTSGQATRVSLRAVPAAHLRFTFDHACPLRFATVQVLGESGVPQLVVTLPALDKRGLDALTVAAGHVKWTLTFWSPGATTAPVTRDGSADMASGETTTVEVSLGSR